MGLFKTMMGFRKVKYGTVSEKVVPLFTNGFHKGNRHFTEVDEEDLMEYDVETQNGIPVRFNTGFLETSKRNYGKHNGDKNFKVENLGQGFEFSLVDMENKSNIYEVLLVTDEYVYINDPVNEGIIIKNHKELRDLKYMILAV